MDGKLDLVQRKSLGFWLGEYIDSINLRQTLVYG